MKAANDLAVVFEKARNGNLRYAFWSNLALVPFSGAMVALVGFSAGRPAIAGVGLGTAALAGTNSMLNARPNAKVYQAGLNAIDCEIVNLTPYNSLPVPDSTSLQASLKHVNDQNLTDVGNIFSTDATALTTLTTALDDLKTATDAANKAIADAAAEQQLKAQAWVFAEVATQSIASAVASKISQTDIDATRLLAAMTTAATPSTGTTPDATGPTSGDLNLSARSRLTQNALTAANPPAGARNFAARLAPQETPADRTAKIKAAIEGLARDTAKLQQNITAFQLAAAETTVTACVKAVMAGS